MKGMTVSIYSDDFDATCSPCANFKYITLTGEGIPERSEPTDDVPEYRITSRKIQGEDYYSASMVKNGQVKIKPFGGLYCGLPTVGSFRDMMNSERKLPLLPVHDWIGG